MVQETQQHLKAIAKIVQQHLDLWDIPTGATAEVINVSENITFLVTDLQGHKAVLRLHRQGYHSYEEIQSELSWSEALLHENILSTAQPILGKNGETIQILPSNSLHPSRFMVLFQYLEGEMPDETGDLQAGFYRLGEIAAQCHQHARKWERPQGFRRKSWDLSAVFGANSIWGNWRDAPNINNMDMQVLEGVQKKITERLEAYGKSPDRFNLIHADMRLANLIEHGENTHVIDFDDCGFGWFMYDFAAAVSFFEDDPRIGALKMAWLAGYRRHRALSEADISEIDTLIMLRRMALLAWIGSHIEAPEPQKYAPDFARVSAALGRRWLSQFNGD